MSDGFARDRYSAELEEAIRGLAAPLESAHDLDPLLASTEGARLVLIGEASHGTSEFQAWRARLTQRLIQEQGFGFVAVEGDWPDCFRANRFVKGGQGAGADAAGALQAFERWPTWMWGNWEVEAFLGWLRQHNLEDVAEPQQRVGFYGLDVYSLRESLAAVLDYVEVHVPEAIALARRAARCFDPHGRDPERYAWYTRLVPRSCEEEVVQLLVELRRRAGDAGARAGLEAEAALDAEQNARVLVDAERYYRTMIRSGAGSWNVRDEHMMDTLDRLLQHHGHGSRGVVWAHNTHVGDARATDMAAAKMFNIGQLARERYGDVRVRLVGSGSARGSVIAASEWGAQMEWMRVPPARSGSWEDSLHRALDARDALLLLRGSGAPGIVAATRGQRAIGVMYAPERDAVGNYVPTSLSRRYDAFLYLDTTRALHPLGLHADPARRPETYPFGV